MQIENLKSSKKMIVNAGIIKGGVDGCPPPHKDLRNPWPCPAPKKKL
jgi:hypothetical protein